MEKAGEIGKLNNSVNFQALIYHFKGLTKDIEFDDLINAETHQIKTKEIRFEDAEKIQMEFELKLSSVKIGGTKSGKELSEIEDITKFYISPETFIKFYNDYFVHKIHKAASDWKLGKGLKILTPRQMHQKLPIAFTQGKTGGNTYKNLINEIRQVISSLYQEEEVTKQIYNKIMNSIKW